MSTTKALPVTLKIPSSWLTHQRSLQELIASQLSCRPGFIHKLYEQFSLCPDEKRFTKELLHKKPNLWIFRTNQRLFCGDFLIVDMSSPRPKMRDVFLLDLKLGAPLKLGGGGAGIQFKNARKAIEDVALQTSIVPPDTNVQLISGARCAVLRFFGLPTFSLS